MSGSIPPRPGFKPIPDLEHVAPVFAIAGQLGGGARNLAIAAELSYEHMLRRVKEPSRLGVRLFGFGVTGSYYFEHDWFATAHLRWVSALLFMPDVECIWECMQGAGGPGVGLTLGKEWFSDEEPRERDYERDRARDRADGADRVDRRRERHHHEDEGGIGLAIQGNYARLGDAPELTVASGLVLLSLTHF